MKENPSYYAVIPANVRYDTNLTANAKLLYGEITALCNDKGYCWASNNYFSNLYNVSKVSISKWVHQLEKLGYVSCEIVYKEGSKEILNRYIRIVNDPIKEKLNTPIKEKLKDNNTFINKTLNNIYTKHIPEDLILEWMVHRKKKAITKRVYENLEKEANALGWTVIQAIEYACANSWQGFKAEWVNKLNNVNDRSGAMQAIFGKQIIEKDITNDAAPF